MKKFSGLLLMGVFWIVPVMVGCLVVHWGIEHGSITAIIGAAPVTVFVFLIEGMTFLTPALAAWKGGDGQRW
jgi:hypothetical protein